MATDTGDLWAIDAKSQLRKSFGGVYSGCPCPLLVKVAVAAQHQHVAMGHSQTPVGEVKRAINSGRDEFARSEITPLRAS